MKQLRDEPQKVADRLRGNFVAAVTQALFRSQAEMVIVQDHELAIQEVINHWKACFAHDIAELPA